MASQTVFTMARELRKASRSNDAPIWSRLSREALKPSAARRTINLNKMSKLTREGDAVFFAGKVLGTGAISHKITLCSFSISRTAAQKVLASGGSIQGYREMVSQFPTGKGVVLLG